MKKILLSFAMFSLLTSCNDSLSPEQPAEPSGTVILDAGFDYSDGEETKLSNAWENYFNYPYTVWEEGDNFKLVTYADSIYQSSAYPKGNFKFTDCGAFTLKEGAGKSAGKFIGCIPEKAASSTNGLAFFPSENYVDFYFNKSDINPVHGVYSFSISGLQDGTGFKYMSAISKFKDGSISGFQFASVLWHMWVPSGAQIDSIKVDAGAQQIAGKCSIYYKNDDGTVTSPTLAGKESLFTIKIYKEDEKQSGNVFFVTRNIPKDVSKVVMTFYKGNESVKTVKFTMPKANLSTFLTLGCPLIGGYDATAVWQQSQPLSSAHPDQYAEFPYMGGKYTIGGKSVGYTIYDITRPGTKSSSEDTSKALGFSDKGPIAELVSEREYKFTSATTDSTVYTIKFGGANYSYGSWSNNSPIRMNTGAYTSTPVYPGKKLVGVKMTPYNAWTGTATDLRFKVASDSAGTSVLDGGELKPLYKLAKDKDYPIGKLSKDVFAAQYWWLYGTEEGKSYYLISNKGSSMTSKMEFLYK